jgi:Fur family ferric uptake transcriptional regulator
MLTEIFEKEVPFSVAELHCALEDRLAVDLVTVYRFLNLLQEKGIVRCFRGPGNEQFFEKACVHNPLHPHFVCRKCGQLTCLKDLLFDDSVWRATLEEEGYHPEGVTLVVRGLCPRCAEEEGK